MPIDFLTDLEQKIDVLLTNLEQLREEKKSLALELEGKNQRITQLESEIHSLESVNTDSENKRKVVTDKIQGLLAKLEAV